MSLGVMAAQHLVQNRPGAQGLLAYFAFADPSYFGEWPEGVPVQIHAMDADPFFVGEGDLEPAQKFVDSYEQGELFLYPGDGHLFADSSRRRLRRGGHPAAAGAVVRAAQRRRRVSDQPADEVRVVPANEATWEDLQAVLGSRGAASRCQCQRFRLGRGESFGSLPGRRSGPSGCGSRPTRAIPADRPAGWSATSAPTRSAGARSSRGRRTTGWCGCSGCPWEGRDEDRTDPSVWAVTCVFTRRASAAAG